MKTKQLFISLIFGLGLTLALLWLLSGGKPSAHADSPHRVAPDCTGILAPCHTTIQEAVDAAIPGDEIHVAAGTYTGVQGRPAPPGYDGPSVITQVVYINKNVTIRGGYNADFSAWDPDTYYTTLDAQRQGRVLYIARDINPTIEGLYITGGDADGLGGGYSNTDAGGGVYLINDRPTLSNCKVFSNTANSRGGGLYLHYSGATLSRNIVISNTANDKGGGLYLYHSPATLSENNITANKAITGGGLYLYSSDDAVLSENNIISNHADDRGGGLYLSSSNAVLSENNITANKAITSGGGLYLYSSPATLSENNIISNHADDSGGGLYLSSSSAKLLSNTITANTADDKGGGLYLSSNSARLISNTITANTADDKGGGLYLYTSTATLRDNNVTSNIAWEGGGLYLASSPATLSGNTVAANIANEDGGGLCLYSSDAIFSGNTVISNTAHDSGGGLYLSSSAATLNGNTVTANHADRYGGGLRLYSGIVTLTNNIIAANCAMSAGSGLYVEHSSAHLLHTTIARNSGGDGSGVHVTNEGSSYSIVALTNTILVSHTVGINVTVGNTATLECTLWGTDAWANDADWGGAGTIITGTRNYWEDPAFVGPDAGDYHIGLTSAAIDKGVNADVYDDIDGDLRPMGGYEIGADELPGILLPIVMKGYCGPDNYEPNDQCDDDHAYGPLISGQTYQSWISCYDLATPQRSDYFYIDINITSAINITLTNIPPGTDYDLYLYNNLCSLVAKSDNPGAHPEEISYPPLTTGKYYIRVYSYSGSSTSPYSLQVTYD